MRRKSAKPLEILPFRFLPVEIITDPAEIAAAERRRKGLRSKKRKKATNKIIKAEIVTDPVEIARMEKLRLQLRKRKRGGASKRSSA